MTENKQGLRSKLASHRVAVYCVVTFALTWGFWFATVYPQAIPLLQAGENPLSGNIMVAVAAGMLFPALSVVLTRLITGEGFKKAWIVPKKLKRTWKYYVFGWFGPIVLVAFGGVLFFVLNPADFDPSMQGYVDTINAQIAQSGFPLTMSAEEIRQTALLSFALIFVAPLLNFVACFGEEWGWRGYLLPHLTQKHSVTFAVVTSGIIWGLWHAPITVLGHNYGLGYPGWPVLGIIAMCCFCVVVGCFFSWLTLRSKSCLPAVFAHGALNGCASAPLMFMAVSANPFIGPAASGIIGGAGFLIVSIACFVALRKNGGRVDELS